MIGKDSNTQEMCAMSERLPNTGETPNYPSPGEDFFRHVNGEWLENTKMPEGHARYGSYDIIGKRTTEDLVDIADDLCGHADSDFEKGSPEQQVRDFYFSGISMATRNERGLHPLDNLRTEIASIQDREDIVPVVAKLRRSGVSSFFSVGFDEDDRQAGSNALYIGQGGLGLPNREYYLQNDKRRLDIRYYYNEFQQAGFVLLGKEPDEAAQSAEAAYNIEHSLAVSSLPAAEARIADKNYFKFTLDEAKQEFPGIEWDEYFSVLGKSNINSIVVQQPEFLHKVEELLQFGDIDDIKSYLEFSLFNTYAAHLDQEAIDVNFAFKGGVLSGISQQKPLKERIVDMFNGLPLKDAIGPLYCERHFDEASKAKLVEMVGDVKSAFADRVARLGWMSYETKSLTMQKLDNISFKMGYPDQWNDVSDVDIVPNEYAKNLMTMSAYSLDKKLGSLDEPYDRSQWHMPPTLVNACSDLKREMTFPAAVLQAPFFDPNQDDAYNYGAIGCTMGHELTHFFDDQGCKFDLEGNMNSWWNKADEDNFTKKTRPFAAYFGSLTFMDMQINGDLTLGENIADVGGIKIAYGAYQKKLARDGGANEIVDGMTPEQRFFVGWARKWMTMITPEAAERQITTDPHSPGKIRVNGVLAITPEFHKAFGLREGDPMYVAPENLPTLW